MPIYALGDLVPSVHADAFVHPDAVLIGAVTLGAFSTVWPGAVLRADDGNIFVGARTSVQDGSVIHTTAAHPTTIGSGCVIGHMVHLEGCVIEDDALVGNGAVVLHRARVCSGSIVGSNAVVTAGTVVPPRAMALGVPAKIREDAVPDPSRIHEAAASYVSRAARYRTGLRAIG
jgi:carbonic anhydrase/acetyltransferase-like protein (isoleucine patch superfamily)